MKSTEFKKGEQAGHAEGCKTILISIRNWIRDNPLATIEQLKICIDLAFDKAQTKAKNKPKKEKKK